MSSLISLDSVSIAFGLAPLLDAVKFQVESGERICLIGRNGEGKSTLLKIIAGDIDPDAGNIWRAPTLKIAKLAQDLPTTDMTVYEFIAAGFPIQGELLAQYHQLLHRIEITPTPALLKKLSDVQSAVDASGAWQIDNEIQQIMTRLDLDPDIKITALSGGWQRRAALAQALVSAPDLLLLDEPTNHMDIAAIEWLEEYLLNCRAAVIFITHDRALLQRLATRIIELDRGQLTSWPHDYQNYLRRKEETLHAEDLENARFDKKLAQEEVWIRQGVKARRTRNEGRVRHLETMRREREARLGRTGTASLAINTGNASGKVVVDAIDVSYSYSAEAEPIIRDFSLRIMRGDHIGLIGPNGVGKTTLLNLLLGKLPPTTGIINRGTKLETIYFDQLRDKLDLNKNILDNVAQGQQSITINGKEKHIISYLNDFLFNRDRIFTPLSALSGGEKNRVLLAKLFSQPANLMVLDEPTNDLDMDTLELLEELLMEYTGTLLIVSHDRAFINNVVTSTLVFEGHGRIQEYVGGYQSKFSRLQSTQLASPTSKPKVDRQRGATKMSYKEQRELAEIPKKIEDLESKQQNLMQEINAAAFQTLDFATQSKTYADLSALEETLLQYYARWTTLEDKSNN